MTVTYSIDKYREGEDLSSNMEEVTGYMAYINNPITSSFINLDMGDRLLSISRDLVTKIEWYDMPKWNIISEDNVVDSAKVRILNLSNELEIAKNTFDQEQRLEETKDRDV
tara:strand:+ start:441 stop:773 length:333 start_codon:yes stop_codon:yes gene_type:complete